MKNGKQKKGKGKILSSNLEQMIKGPTKISENPANWTKGIGRPKK
ncbi:MAG: hypothetical protein ACYDHY_07165 [Acidiferrobacterales bacterium]